jgi:uncharacterized membrane protein YphA (DoxX/SURF4 family)
VKILKKTLHVLLGIAFLGAGGQKLAGATQMVDEFDRYRYPQWFRLVTGAVELGGAAGLLLGLVRPTLVPLAGLLLVPTMLGAIATHIRINDPTSKMAPPAVLLALTIVVLVIHEKE